MRKYLRTHHGEPCTITGVRSDNYKGKDQWIITFEAEDGALIDLKAPKSDSDKQYARGQYLLKSLCSATGAKGSGELKGKRVSVTVARNDWQGKPYYNPIAFAPVSYTSSTEETGGEGASNEGEDFNF